MLVLILTVSVTLLAMLSLEGILASTISKKSLSVLVLLVIRMEDTTLGHGDFGILVEMSASGAINRSCKQIIKVLILLIVYHFLLLIFKE